ncbi:4'-phosphopantetheinyl transferase [Gordonia sp. 852002-50816_SCH5313054-c]|uniref:4'-phosphopantetheinyl transferase family protein n=1 Tax=unclassified Gordonia (in: high G+C Gram-positive bacteria) TaxID=2657482 RepID=UPI0007EB8159|nr:MULTISPECIES: 4'-phosphopantetheinyl transferase [unclassified Gordonia (in: high G+C Gram-positive bacteria)]OBC12870.1 4'-phosphopantetheinyl transferase [Gordonia sp. 852002-50816_SCH5313054-a]OBC18867.1 4'-phosphopantetheinyl transferase [Gordonia sp. 852002-50816_SCH5313054-c]
MIERLLPPGVASAESFGDPPGLEPMPAEESLISRAVEKRRREFITARHCARQALGQLGIEPTPIMRGDKGMPLWPNQIVGSLTHCDGYRAAIVAYAMGVRTLGIDAEPHDVLPDGVLEHTSIPAERNVIAQRPSGLHWDRLLFCAKETTYKAWFPLTQRWLGFEDAHITFEQTAENMGTFRSRILIDGSVIDGGTPITEFSGRWLVDDGYITTTIVMS